MLERAKGPNSGATRAHIQSQGTVHSGNRRNVRTTTGGGGQGQRHARYDTQDSRPTPKFHQESEISEQPRPSSHVLQPTCAKHSKDGYLPKV